MTVNIPDLITDALPNSKIFDCLKTHPKQLYTQLRHAVLRNITCHNNAVNSLSQKTPLPVKPGLHEQVKLPGVLTQVALWWQLSRPVSHSFMSRQIPLLSVASYTSL